MITVTREAEADMRALLATRLMLADERDALRQAIDAIADARARGQRYLIVRHTSIHPLTGAETRGDSVTYKIVD